MQPLGDNQRLLQAINTGGFLLNGFRNRDLQLILFGEPADDEKERRRRSAAISRKLRAHGLIRKVSHTPRYMVNKDESTIVVAILTAARTTLNQLATTA